ncbi:hypothetical protein [Acinetobacter baumannii]|uniref:hypothetical protein n=1 Tax=Acinetobacter baumannii TaxID=470 RepID=UPI003AF871B2
MEKISKFFLILGIFTTPFYVFSSGSLQPSHFLLLLFAFFWVIYKKGFYVDRQLFLLSMPFFSYVILVNLVYSLYYQDPIFFSYPLNLVFDFIIIFTLTSCLNNLDGNQIKKIPYIMFAILAMLFSIWLAGLGAYKFYPRYNGYFNDPNQMAFFVLCIATIACLYIKNLILYLLTIFLALSLILFTQSRSAIVGVVVLLSSLFFLYWKGSYKSIFISVFILILLLIFIFIFGDDILKINYVQSVVGRFESADLEEQSDVRGYTRILNFPEYLFFGAGQGLDKRFGSTVEIHSTWAGIFFYYGIIGIFLFLFFLINIFKKLTIYQKVLFVVPLMYSFSTFGARTVIFWILVACFYHAANFKNANKKVLL